MKRNIVITENEQEKQILQDALRASENEYLDLYKVILGGNAGPVCDGNPKLTSEAYSDFGGFLRSIDPK